MRVTFANGDLRQELHLRGGGESSGRTVGREFWFEAHGATQGASRPTAADAALWSVSAEAWGPRALPGTETLRIDCAALPTVKGVSVSWRSRAPGWPFGELVIVYRILDGRLASILPGSDDLGQVDAVFSIPHTRRVMRQVHATPAVELISEGSTLSGSVEAAMFVAGYVEGPEWKDQIVLPPDVAEDWLVFCDAYYATSDGQ